LMIGGEYGTGMVRVTFAAMPRRSAVLAAKATVLLGVVLAAAASAVLASLLAARGAGLSLDGEPVWRAAFGSVLYLALIALLSLGVGAAVRSSAAAVGVVLGLLYVFPLVAQAAADPDWQRRLEQIGPTTAGLAIQATANLDELPLGPWEGLGVLALWAAAALLAGTLLLEYRDA
jgi:ABC-2 type transport system permease protein